MQLILQQIANGIMAGSLYMLIGLGLTLIYGVMELTNFAHGEFAMLGGYATFFSMLWLGNNYFLAVLCAAGAGVLIGLLVNRIAFTPLAGSNSINLMISSLGISTLLVNLAQYFFKADPRVVRTVYNKQIIHVGPIFFTGQRLMVTVLALLLSAAVNVVIKKNRFGFAIRATSTNAVTASLYGINTKRTALYGFLLGTMLASVAGALMAPIFNVFPTMGIALTTKSFVVVVLGGMGSIPGAIIGGLTIGLVESLSSLISSRYVDLFVYMILFVVLIFKPQGIISTYRREKV
jgi:branched-chain amino acid transport system permease protein